MLWVLVLTVLGVLALRRRNVRDDLVLGVAVGGVVFAIFVAVMDPGARPSWAGLRNFGIFLLLLVPIYAYFQMLQRVRRRNDPNTDGAEIAHPTGFVLIADDEALSDEVFEKFQTANREVMPDWGREDFSVAYRDEAGAVLASGRVSLNMGLADVSRVWVEPDVRGGGLGRELMHQIEREARARGAERVLLNTYSWQAERFYLGLGYGEIGRVAYPGGAERIYLVKDLE